METSKIVLAGFGGQGVLFAGKLIAYTGMVADKEVSWLPSYGPEMRGGTANCSVTVSNELIGSPLVTEPNILVAMNAPSLDKFEDAVEKDGTVIIDSSLIERKATRDDINAFYIPATQMAKDNGLSGLSNMILLGKVIKESKICDLDTFKIALEKVIPARKAHLIPKNLEAVKLGYDF